MGSVRLKTKDKLEYRKVLAHERSRSCIECDHLRLMQVIGLGDEDLGIHYRCLTMGIGTSRKYNINPDCTCSAFKKRKIGLCPRMGKEEVARGAL